MFDRIGLTLYDLLGYLLPGYVLIFACSLIESTFLGSDLLCLTRVRDNLLAFSIVAYFAGQATHTVGSLLKEWRHGWFSDRAHRLSSPLFERVRDIVKDVYRIKLQGEAKLDKLEVYLLADSYVVATGGSIERDTLMAREGFFKASMVAFGLLSLLLFSTLTVGGVKVQTQPGAITQLKWPATVALAVVFSVLTLLFRRGYLFYNRIKINNIMLLFLSLRERDVLISKKE